MSSGAMNWIEVAVASGIRKMLEKKVTVAPARKKPRASCTLGRGKRKPCGPSRISSTSPSPIAPSVKRSAATAMPGHWPAVDLISPSPQESSAKPSSANSIPAPRWRLAASLFSAFVVFSAKSSRLLVGC